MTGRFGRWLIVLLVGGVCMASGVAAATPEPAGAPGGAHPDQDAEVLRFVERQAAWFPGSTFEVLEDEARVTPDGPYRWLVVERTCESPYLSGQTTLVVDPQAERVWIGSVAELPPELGRQGLRESLDDFLPQALTANFGRRVRVVWGGSPRKPTGVLEFQLAMASGYGDFLRPAAVTADGRYLMLGAVYPWGEDPVAYRRQMLHDSDLVMWDHGSNGVDVVEFSDFQCPGCRGKWSLVKELLDTFEGKLRHGMVNFPLTRIHPWAFRGASAAWCVVEQDPSQLVGLKELFYSLQREMTVDEVAPTALDFVDAGGLDAEAFEACYLREVSVNSVLQQRSVGARIGINATPTFIINGWLVQVPDREWLEPMLQRLIDGQEP